MRALVAPRLGTPEVLELQDVPQPSAGEGQVLIQVHRAGVNFADISSINGSYAQAPTPPFIPGLEVSGFEVETGQPVVAMVPSGAYAEVVAADRKLVWDATGLELDEAAGWPLVSQTAYHALAHMARLRAGDEVIITAAAGGLGSALVMVAKALGAGRITGIASTEEKRAKVMEMGADAAIGYEDELPKVDVAVDSVGGETFGKIIEALRPFGRVVLLGATSGQVQQIPSVGVLRVKGVGVMPFSLGAYRANNLDSFAETAAEGWELVRSGSVRPPVGSVVPLADAREALESLAARATTGKLLLLIGG